MRQCLDQIRLRRGMLFAAPMGLGNPMTRTLLLLTACLALSTCFGRGALSTAGTVTGAAIRSGGNIVSGAVQVVTRDAHIPTEIPTVRTESEVIP